MNARLLIRHHPLLDPLLAQSATSSDSSASRQARASPLVNTSSQVIDKLSNSVAHDKEVSDGTLVTARGPTRMTCRPSQGQVEPYSQSGDIVEIAHLDTHNKMSPLIRGERINGTCRAIRVSDQDKFALTRNPDARAALACA